MKHASNKLGFALLLAFGPLLLAGLDGCGGDRCEPGYYLENHVCYQTPASAGAAGDTGSAGAPSCDDPNVSTFGADCRVAAECVCDSDFCAANPGSVGFCTRTGCDTDPSVCPSGHACVDLSGFGPGLPSICVPP
jgi:hypothetical protein